jgi:ATP-dependent helicase/nuclease subunit A
VLAHPVLDAASRAAREGRCYREMPVTIRADSGAIIEGVVDLAYEDEQGFVVVDFKTDRELDGALERYQQQVAIYASAVGAAMSRPTRAILMRV